MRMNLQVAVLSSGLSAREGRDQLIPTYLVEEKPLKDNVIYGFATTFESGPHSS